MKRGRITSLLEAYTVRVNWEGCTREGEGARVVRALLREETRELEGRTRKLKGRARGRRPAILKGRAREEKLLRLLFGYEISCSDLYKIETEYKGARL